MKNIRIQRKISILGRTIVEMIALIAIIGILSIATVSGVGYVLDKNKANAILKEAISQAAEIKTGRFKKLHTSEPKKGEIIYPYESKSLYIVSRTYNNDYLVLKTDATISKDVCNKLISEEGVSVSVFKSITSDGKYECDEVNEMVFITDINVLLEPDINELLEPTKK